MNYLIYLFLFLIAFLMMSLYDLYSAFLLALLLLLVPLLLASLGWAAEKQTTLTLLLPPRAREGETAEICLAAKGRFLPFLSSVTCFLGDEEYSSYEEEKDEIRFYFSKEALHCGRLSIENGYISFSDPFGLFHRKLSAPGANLLVMPRLIGERETTRKALLSLSTPENKEYFGAVPYRAGDNPHLINWKVTARKDDVYVREGEPDSASELILAADYEEAEMLRDTVCDVLYSAGHSLASSHVAFRFAWVTREGLSVLSTIQNTEEWENAIRHFLEKGGAMALKEAPLSPSVPICYLTGQTSPSIAPSLSPVIWCAAEGNSRASLSGRSALFHALGGEES